MSNIIIFSCPLCRSALSLTGRTLLCVNGHSYDIAREGYVNLLLANQKGSSEPGDSREMLISRSRFLNSGHYTRLSDALAEVIKDQIEMKQYTLRVLDAGCGEGWYADTLSRVNGIKDLAEFAGIDISKDGVRLAAKRNRDISWGVAGVHSIPLADSTIDIILNIFAPHDAGEFHRILKDDGILITATPGASHLLGLKKLLYDSATLHDAEPVELSGFSIHHRGRVEYEFTLSESSEKLDLIKMTPYYWKTDPARITELTASPEPLVTEADFCITVYRKI